jgi:phosphonatase-like hydrolase
MNITLAVFDMAGTTVQDDDVVNDLLRRALAASGIEVDREAANRVMGEPKPVAIAKLVGLARSAHLDATDPFVIAIHENFIAAMLDHYRTSPSVRASEGARDVFDTLRRYGVRVALDTGFNRRIADAILQRLGWSGRDVVDATIASDEVAKGRPHPDMIERAMKLTGVSHATSVAKIGDTPADLYEGTTAGCGIVIGVTTGSHTRAALAEHPHTYLVERLAEVPPLLLRAVT